MFKQAHLFEHLEFTARNAMALEHSAIRGELAPCVIFRFRGSRSRCIVNQEFCIRIRQKEHLTPVKPEDDGKVPDKRQRGSAPVALDVCDVASLHTDLRREPPLGKPERLACLFDHRTEIGFLFHISYSDSKTQRRRTKCIMPAR